MRKKIRDPLEEAIYNPSRKKLYDLIVKNPGLHFREIQRRTKFATGMLQYHLDFLQKKHLIRQDKKDGYVRYYSIRKGLSDKDKAIMNLLRSQISRHIVLSLLKHIRPVSISFLEKETKLNKQKLLFYLAKIENAGFLEKKKSKKEFLYKLKERNTFAILLKKYRKSFLDSLVDNFIDTWSKIELIK